MSTPALRVDAQRTVDSILEAARVVLAADPAATVTEIAERSLVHRTTISRYFPNREALVTALMHTMLSTLEARFAALRLNDDAVEALRELTRVWVDESRRWRASRYAPLGSISGANAMTGLREKVLTVIERGQEQGVMRADLPAGKLFVACSSYTMSAITLQSDPSPDEIADDVVALLTR